MKVYSLVKKRVKILEEFVKRNVISVTVVRRDIYCITENSKVYKERRMPYYLVPKITCYYKVKQFHFLEHGKSKTMKKCAF